MKHLSDQNRTCFLYESGTYAATSGNRQWLGEVQTHDLSPNMNVMPIRYQGSTDRNVEDFADGKKEWKGKITYFPQDWKFLGFAIGSIQDKTGSHLFTENNTNDRVQPYDIPLYSFAIEDSKDAGHVGSNFIRTTVGGMVDTYKLTAKQGEIVSCEIDYLAQDSTLSSGAVAALAATTTKPYIFNNVQLQIPDGTLIDNAIEVDFTVKNNLKGGFYLNGSRTAKEMLPMNRDYEMTVTADMDTSNARTFYDSYYIAGSTFNSLLWIRGTAGSLSLVMSGCKITDMTVPSPLEGTQEQSFKVVPTDCYATAYDSISKYNAF